MLHERRKMTKYEKTMLYDKCNGRCAYCGEQIAFADMQIEHAEPISRGGLDTPDNQFPACEACNKAKGYRTLEEFRADLERWPKIIRDSPFYSNAVRFGIVEVKARKIVFYFERVGV
jgi:CRISPR/Cas system Type II protein with McrA/HNH and RuvC-like nuclease domain